MKSAAAAYQCEAKETSLSRPDQDRAELAVARAEVVGQHGVCCQHEARHDDNGNDHPAVGHAAMRLGEFDAHAPGGRGVGQPRAQFVDRVMADLVGFLILLLLHLQM